MAKCMFMVMLLPLAMGFVSYQPEQVHIAYGDDPWELSITWNTKNNTNQSVVEYGIGGLVLHEESVPEEFVSPDNNTNVQYIHRVRITDLTPDSKYVYHVGSDHGWSDVFWFKTPPLDDWAPQIAIFGDLGNENAVSLPRLQEETQRGLYDAILHVGDFAYDMYMEDGKRGDEFMRQIQSIAAYVPYMTCVGNHEERYNFTHYRRRFSMPGDTEGLFYSFNMGPVHFIAISTEVYYFLQYSIKMLVKQYQWLENDLKEATSPENRAVRPWIIVYGHRPMYCSNLNSDDCTYFETKTRVGLPPFSWFGLEPMFYKYGVDVLIWAHEHSYERMWPLYDYKVYNGSYEQPYVNPRAPVHITSGSAGCHELHDDFKPYTPEWSAFRTTDYGFMRMKIFNSSHLYMEQISEDLLGMVVDRMWLIKDNHGPYTDLENKPAAYMELEDKPAAYMDLEDKPAAYMDTHSSSTSSSHCSANSFVCFLLSISYLTS